MKKEILPELLQKYLRGDASPEETNEVDAWYASLQENPDDISLLDPLESHIAQQKIFDRTKSNIDLTETEKNSNDRYFLTTPFKLVAAKINVFITLFFGNRMRN